MDLINEDEIKFESIKDLFADPIFLYYYKKPRGSWRLPPIYDQFMPIGQLFLEDCYKRITDFYILNNKLIISGRNQKGPCKLELKFGSMNDNRFIIPEIEFIHRRKGNMTKLYKILKILQSEYNQREIVIENVTSESMENWCLKNGFRKVGRRNYIEK